MAVCWNGHPNDEDARSCPRCGAHAAPDWARFEPPSPWWRRANVLVPLIVAVVLVLALIAVLVAG